MLVKIYREVNAGDGYSHPIYMGMLPQRNKKPVANTTGFQVRRDNRAVRDGLYLCE
jgi:hypothetical protein